RFVAGRKARSAMFPKYDASGMRQKNARPRTGVEGGVMLSLEERRRAGYRRFPTTKLQGRSGDPAQIGGAGVVSEECRCASLAKVPCEHARLGSPKVDYDQPVESVAELVVGAESEQTPPQLQVLLEEDGYAFVVVLDLRDDAGQVLDVSEFRNLDLVSD